MRTLLTDLVIGESPRWHDARLWSSNWGTQEVLAVDADGKSEVLARVPTTIPFSIDWLPDGRLLVVSGQEGLLLRQEPDGTLVTPDGAVRQVADRIAFPNGMVVTPDNRTLIVAESFTGRLTAFDIAADGGLANRRVWFDFGGPGNGDGICLDADGAVWASTMDSTVARVREGDGVLDRIRLDAACFACMLGGADGRTLFMLVADWHPGEDFSANMQRLTTGPRTGRILTAPAPAPAPHAGRP